MPVGLEDVSKYPDLFAELIRRGWTDNDLMKLAGNNIIRVLRGAEKVLIQALVYYSKNKGTHTSFGVL